MSSGLTRHVERCHRIAFLSKDRRQVVVAAREAGKRAFHSFLRQISLNFASFPDGDDRIVVLAEIGQRGTQVVEAASEMATRTIRGALVELSIKVDGFASLFGRLLAPAHFREDVAQSGRQPCDLARDQVLLLG